MLAKSARKELRLYPGIKGGIELSQNGLVFCGGDSLLNRLCYLNSGLVSRAGIHIGAEHQCGSRRSFIQREEPILMQSVIYGAVLFNQCHLFAVAVDGILCTFRAEANEVHNVLGILQIDPGHAVTAEEAFLNGVIENIPHHLLTCVDLIRTVGIPGQTLSDGGIVTQFKAVIVKVYIPVAVRRADSAAEAHISNGLVIAKNLKISSEQILCNLLNLQNHKRSLLLLCDFSVFDFQFPQLCQNVFAEGLLLDIIESQEEAPLNGFRIEEDQGGFCQGKIVVGQAHQQAELVLKDYIFEFHAITSDCGSAQSGDVPGSFPPQNVTQ